MDEKNIVTTESEKQNKNRERFVRIAEMRVVRVLDALESLGNCSNRRNYAYTEKDVKKIFSEVDKKLREVRSMFHETAKDKKRFKLEP